MDTFILTRLYQYQTDLSLKPYNTFGIDVRARHFVRADSLAALRQALAEPAFAGLPRLILGGGSNILFTRDFDGVVIKPDLLGREVARQDEEAVYLRGMAGENWHEFVQWSIAQGCAGLENLSLIPGSVGAAPIQNIGAYGVEIKDYFDSLEALDIASGAVRTFQAAECGFGYRDSVFKQAERDRYVIVAVTFRLPRQPVFHTEYGEVAAELARQGVAQPGARRISETICAIRRRKLPDPAEIGSAGSFFKNPQVSQAESERIRAGFPGLVAYLQSDGRVKLAAGWLIDQCGWKGRRQGGAGVYEKQALVLVNRGGASGADVWALAQAVQRSVEQKFGVRLEAEPVVL